MMPRVDTYKGPKITVGLAVFNKYLVSTSTTSDSDYLFESIIYRISDGRIMEHDLDITLESAEQRYQRNCKLADDAPRYISVLDFREEDEE